MGSIICHIMLLVINSLEGGHTLMQTQTHSNTHTHTYTDDLHKINFKKPGVHRPVADAPGLIKEVRTYQHI